MFKKEVSLNAVSYMRIGMEIEPRDIACARPLVLPQYGKETKQESYHGQN